MSATQEQRECFVAELCQAYPTDRHAVHVARRLMRQGTTHCRLAEALCNGDWPCDNGERKLKECPECGTGYAPSSFRKGVCPDCRCEELVKEIALELGDNGTPTPDVVFTGDPRGCTICLHYGERTLYVPTS